MDGQPPMPFVLEYARLMEGGMPLTLREYHGSLAGAIEGFIEQQQRGWHRVRMIPVGPGTPLGRNLAQLWLLLEEA